MPTAGKTIFLIEDEDIVRTLARRLFESEGFLVLDAKTLEGALKIWKEERAAIDLVFADVQLEDGNSLSTVRDFLDEKPGLKVIFTSGYNEDVVRNGSGRIPAAAFVQKPFHPRELMRAIRDAFEGTK